MDGGLGQTVFKFYRIYCNTLTVLIQIQRVSFYRIINCMLPAGFSIDLNCLFKPEVSSEFTVVY